MRIELICTGDELLDGRVVNSNARDVGEKLMAKGLRLHSAAIVSDRLEDICAEIEERSKRTDLLIITGGLGPTEDDRTAEALARACGSLLRENQKARRMVTSFFEQRGRVMSDSNLKQALLPEGAEPVPNPLGTAPGIALRLGNCQVVCLPGVPKEMNMMFDEYVSGRILAGISEPVTAAPVTLKVFGLGESVIADRLRYLYPLPQGVEIGFRATGTEVHIIVKPSSFHPASFHPGTERTELERIAEAIKSSLGDHVFTDSQSTLAGGVSELLRNKGLTLALAESCTGGLIGSLITDEAGASDVFLLSAVTYADTAKQRLLDVNKETLRSFGAVSAETAKEMAAGIRELAGASMGLSVTGIAGPGGGTKEKPVGTVYLGFSDGIRLEAKSLLLSGDRRKIRLMAAHHALFWLREKLQH